MNKSESFHVIEGMVDVVLFSEGGEVSKVIKMGSYSSGGCFYYRVASPIYHTLLIRSEVLVFHETTNGPFDRSQMVFAPWSPDERDGAAIASFLGRVERDIQSG